MEPLALTPSQAFEQERFSRAIDATTDLATLRGIAKQLLQAWMTQKAATAWVMREGLQRKAPAAEATGADLPELDQKSSS